MDAVITYVNGNREQWINSYKLNVKTPIDFERYRDYGTLPILINGIRKNMKYIDKIFLVVSDIDQVPNDIDRTDVQIVTHDKIIPKKFLPCFNSCVIEMFLGFIPGLCNEFVYFNDDTFAIAPSEATDFFVNGKPCLLPSVKTTSFLDNPGIYRANCINSTKLLLNRFKFKTLGKQQFLIQQHCARPMTVSSYNAVWKKCKMDIEASLTRVRSSRNYNAYLFNNYDWLTGNYINNGQDSKYFRLNNELKDEIKTHIRNKVSKFVCLNDCSDAFDVKGLFAPTKIVVKQPMIKVVKPASTEKRVALCAIAKNENLYIREWIEWYKNLGIAHIFLYDNNEFDGERFEDVISDYITSGFVEVIDKRGVEKGCVYDEQGINLQTACYIDAYENRVADYDWIMFFDIDEFLMFNNENNLRTFFNNPNISQFDTILVPWKMYIGSNLHYTNEPVTKRFTLESHNKRYGVKSIVKTGLTIDNKLQRNLIHIFRLKGQNVGYANGTTNDEITKNWIIFKEIDSCICVLNHYRTKSFDEYLIRHLGRHWGTGLIHTINPKTFNDCVTKFLYDNTSDIMLDTYISELSRCNDSINVFDNINYVKVLQLSLDKQKLMNNTQDMIYKRKHYSDIVINFENPTTIVEKINWLKVNDILPLKVFCADKILLHDYCRYKLGEDICIPIINVYNNVNEIDFSTLPNQFVIKCNHGYKMNIIVENKQNFNENEVKNQVNKWLNEDFGLQTYQYHYSGIIPKVYAETYMNNGSVGLTDYKFWCINGKPIFVMVINDRFNGKDKIHANVYDMNWNFFDIGWQAFKTNPNILDKRPTTFEKMKEYAEVLSSEFKFVRVDFYEVNNKCYLGELTFTPGNGIFHFYKIFEDKLGDMLKI